MNKKSRKNWHSGRLIADYFTFNRSEQRGIMVLLVILFGLIITNTVIPSETFKQPFDFTAFRKEVIAFEKAWEKAEKDDSLERQKHRFRNSGGLKYSDADTTFKAKWPSLPAFTVELNTADTFELQRLRGIGPAFARRIVNYRQRLGGFMEKQQLMEVFGMDSARFKQIESYLTINSDSIKTVDLNNVTFKALLKHPYFPFEITKSIILYRQKNKKFNSLEELLKIPGITDSLYLRMKVYLRLDL